MKKERHAQWIERYEERKQFKIKNGHCEGPQKYSDNPSIDMWVTNIKINKTQHKQSDVQTRSPTQALKPRDFRLQNHRQNKDS